MSKVYLKLMQVQNELKVPKTHNNTFGKYKYRNCEDIMNAVKPLLSKVGAAVFISDTIKEVNERFYICATAKFICTETGENIESSSFARESETKKGMDVAQVTGASSSYARKYALNGLFLIDDSRQIDSRQPDPSDNLPALKQKAFEAALKRLQDGEKDLIPRIQKAFSLTSAQLKQLEAAKPNTNV